MSSCFFAVVDEDAVADAGGVARMAHLKCDEFSVIADDGVGCFVAGIVAEERQALIISTAVESELPDVDVAGALMVLAVAFDECEFSVGIDAFRFVVLAGGD